MTGLSQQFSPEKLQALQAELEGLHQRLRDVSPGDQYTLDYSSGGKLTMRFNDQVIWQGGDSELAKAYFGIWLREPALSEELRLALLGQK